MASETTNIPRHGRRFGPSKAVSDDIRGEWAQGHAGWVPSARPQRVASGGGIEAAASAHRARGRASREGPGAVDGRRQQRREDGAERGPMWRVVGGSRMVGVAGSRAVWQGLARSRAGSLARSPAGGLARPRMFSRALARSRRGFARAASRGLNGSRGHPVALHVRARARRHRSFASDDPLGLGPTPLGSPQASSLGAAAPSYCSSALASPVAEFLRRRLDEIVGEFPEARGGPAHAAAATTSDDTTTTTTADGDARAGPDRQLIEPRSTPDPSRIHRRSAPDAPESSLRSTPGRSSTPQIGSRSTQIGVRPMVVRRMQARPCSGDGASLASSALPSPARELLAARPPSSAVSGAWAQPPDDLAGGGSSCSSSLPSPVAEFLGRARCPGAPGWRYLVVGGARSGGARKGGHLGPLALHRRLLQIHFDRMTTKRVSLIRATFGDGQHAKTTRRLCYRRREPPEAVRPAGRHVARRELGAAKERPDGVFGYWRSRPPIRPRMDPRSTTNRPDIAPKVPPQRRQVDAKIDPRSGVAQRAGPAPRHADLWVTTQEERMWRLPT